MLTGHVLTGCVVRCYLAMRMHPTPMTYSMAVVCHTAYTALTLGAVPLRVWGTDYHARSVTRQIRAGI